MLRALLVVSCLWLPAVGSAAQSGSADRLSMAGEWRFALDPDDVGVRDRWANTRLDDTIALPGSTDEAHKGHRTVGAAVGRLTRVYEYVGPAWYQRDVTIPATWADKRIVLFLERCHWETQGYVDGAPAGVRISLVAPHERDVSSRLTPGKHTITLRVDNTARVAIGTWGHSITDETQTNWNGIVGKIELRASDPVWIEEVQVYPDPDAHRARVVVTVGNATGGRVTGAVHLRVRDGASEFGRASFAFAVDDLRGTLEAVVPLAPDAPTWDEFSPNMLNLDAQVAVRRGDRELRDEATTAFGLRTLGRSGLRITMNGRPLSLRGTLECAIFPLTGYPPTDQHSWRRILTIARSYGLNHMRFHSWCPPEAAFAAADEVGMMLQVELPLWVSGPVLETDRELAGFERSEAARILRAYGNHPSFCMLSMGNELLLGVDKANPVLLDLVERCRASDPRHLYTCSTAPYDTRRNDDYFVSHAGPKGLLRGVGWFEGNVPGTGYDYEGCLEGVDRPIIAHELGQWAMYPSFAEIAKYTGVLRARNFQEYRRSLAEHGMLDEAEAFRRASGDFMVLLYKEEIERVLRTPDLAGFQLLDVHDFPGQGTALVGMLDPFWDSKGLVTPEKFRRYCAPTVLLLRLRKQVWTVGETLSGDAQVSHYGPADLEAARAEWSVRSEAGKTVASGSLPARDVRRSSLTSLGPLTVPLFDVAAPARLRVELRLGGTGIRNEWDVWVYPKPEPDPHHESVLIAREWGDEARRKLAAGGRVLLFEKGGWLANTVPGSFTPVFWCTRLFGTQPGTMGILCDPAHPALSAFPTEAHSDWQWWDVLTRSTALVLDGTPPDFRPIVQVIDNFDRNHKLGYIWEARVGDGRLLVCSADVESDLDTRPAARQLRHCLLQYVASARFRPAQGLSPSTLDEVLSASPLRRIARAPRADEIDRAELDVSAAANVPRQMQSFPWEALYDRVDRRAEGFGYAVTQGGSWQDPQGSAWHGQPLKLDVTCPPGFTGTLYAHFHDWNRLDRTGEVKLDGQPLGTLGGHADGGVWLAIPVSAADTEDGKVELEAQPGSGPNLMITRIVLVP